MLRPKAALASLVTIAAMLAPVDAWGQVINGDAVAMGFRAGAGQAQFVIRPGQWIPILLQIQPQGSQVVQVDLRAESRDLDGDFISFCEPQVALTPEAGQRRVWVYAAANSHQDVPTQVSVYGASGRLARIALPPVELLSNDRMLVLDISEKPAERLALMGAEDVGGAAEDVGAGEYTRHVTVSRMSAHELPDRWFGLEAVDVLIWDRPNPGALQPAQMAALVEWVRRGGQLAVGIGDTWNALAQSPLAEILPLAGDGPTVTLDRLPAYFGRFAVKNWEAQRFDAAIPVTTADLRDDRNCQFVLRDQCLETTSGVIPLVTMRQVDAGRVTAFSASLRDLLSIPVRQREFFALIAELTPLSPEFRKNANNRMGMGLIQTRYLYDGVTRPISFGGESTALGVLAIFFVVAYIAAATILSWIWLGRHKLTHLSWSVFAGMAVAASALSLVTVSLLSGFAGGVQAVSIVDAEAGRADASARCYFGYRSSLRQTTDLSLPCEGGFLRPLARHPAESSTYATPHRYTDFSTRGRMDDVLMRSTLKQFEGAWHGKLEGAVRAQLIASRATGQLQPSSWITNELRDEMIGGYVIYIDPRAEDLGVPVKITGYTKSYNPRIDTPVPPSYNVLVVELPRIAPGATLRSLGQNQYEDVARRRAAFDARKDTKAIDRPDLRTLWQQQLEWASGVSAMGANPEASVLLGSLRDLYMPNAPPSKVFASSPDFDSVDLPISSDGLPDIDVSHWLARGEAVLLLVAEKPGPGVLHANGAPLPAFAGRTYYRFRAALVYEDQPPRGSPTP